MTRAAALRATGPSRPRSGSVAVAAALLSIGALCGGPACADGEAAMRWITDGDCARAGDAINAGLEKREAKAYLLAGYLYAATGCVEPDLPRAVRYYQRAVELGDVEARAFLGLMHGLGSGVPQDYRVACRWFYYGTRVGDACDDEQAVSMGYAGTVTQLARTKVEYPRMVFDEGTLRVRFDPRTRVVTFASVGKDDAPLRPLARMSPFSRAIEAAYAYAVQVAPVPEPLPTKDYAYEVPWTFTRR